MTDITETAGNLSELAQTTTREDKDALQNTEAAAEGQIIEDKSNITFPDERQNIEDNSNITDPDERQNIEDNSNITDPDEKQNIENNSNVTDPDERQNIEDNSNITDPIEQATNALNDESETMEECELLKGLEVSIDPAIVEKLRAGFLQKFLPTLDKSKLSVEEVLSSQKILIETVEQENTKFQECQSMKQLTQTMVKARKYYSKLLSIKKDMTNLHEKSARLKKRAVRLQQNKQKEELQRAQQKEREHEKERMLAARVAK